MQIKNKLCKRLISRRLRPIQDTKLTLPMAILWWCLNISPRTIILQLRRVLSKKIRKTVCLLTSLLKCQVRVNILKWLNLTNLRKIRSNSAKIRCKVLFVRKTTNYLWTRARTTAIWKKKRCQSLLTTMKWTRTRYLIKESKRGRYLSTWNLR